MICKICGIGISKNHEYCGEHYPKIVWKMSETKKQKIKRKRKYMGWRSTMLKKWEELLTEEE